ncbi:hypothetical protein FOL47_010877 [Perkinsus chesapeaki]|uniref:Nucleoside diphosphate kinase n=1 Tax=Perkinsus chesapeaki TaxID=330153 RepID=A0A7J6MNK2_PERCH|nr:hypothetical protein FOL47_010877 [Perkinsus chesapeaki]
MELNDLFVRAFEVRVRTAGSTTPFDNILAFIQPYNSHLRLLVLVQMLIRYFLRDGTLEMYDIKNRRPFLKRCEYPGVAAKDLYIGSMITVFSRQLKIVEYADEFTRSKLETMKGRTLGMIKPDAYNHIGDILGEIVKAGFVIKNLRMCKLDKQAAQEFYRDHKGKSFFDALIEFVTSDAVVAIELWGDDAVNKWRRLVEGQLRPRYGTDATRNAVHGSDSNENASREIDFFFGRDSRAEETAIFNNCTCCVVRPHIANTAKVGEVVQRILDSGFEISAMRWCFLDKRSCEEFLEVYSGVLPEYTGQVTELSGGPSLAIEVRQDSAVGAFRKFVGPHDPEIAKALRPDTLRAAFGEDRIKNAVHCTDLEEDGQLEVDNICILASQERRELAGEFPFPLGGKHPMGRGPLTAKRAPSLRKGFGSIGLGTHTKKGFFLIDPRFVPQFKVPDLTDCPLKPYVSRQTPVINNARGFWPGGKINP